ncbi:hypothetical protein LEMLEM_LOCUS4053, partial [Lemmus lemmus]
EDSRTSPLTVSITCKEKGPCPRESSLSLKNTSQVQQLPLSLSPPPTHPPSTMSTTITSTAATATTFSATTSTSQPLTLYNKD